GIRRPGTGGGPAAVTRGRPPGGRRAGCPSRGGQLPPATLRRPDQLPNGRLRPPIAALTPRGEMRTPLIVTPSGSRGIVMVKCLIAPCSADGTPLTATSVALSSSPPTGETRQVAEPDATTRFRLAVTSPGPAAVSFRLGPTTRPSGPSCETTRRDRAGKVTSAAPASRSTVPRLKP